ncbi:MAG: ABC transporter substrate-binding protein [Actinopolymorphaceae bacterium]
MPQRARRLRTAVAAGVGVALLAACGGSPATTESGGGGNPETDEIQEVTFLNILPLESLSFTPELVADTCGQFEKEGLKVNFETTQGSAPAIQTVIADSALITRVGDIETIQAAGGKDAPVVNVGTATQRGPIRVVSSKKDPIESAEDFKGKLIGLPSEGGTSSITVDLVVGSAGIAPTEVKRQVVGLAPGVFDLVKAGRIGGYVVSLDTAFALEQQQPDAVVFDPSDAINSGAQLYMTGRKQAEDPEKQEQLRRYLAAIKAAIDFVIKDEANGFAKTMKCISSKYKVPALENPDVTKQALAGYVDSWTANGEDKVLLTDDKKWQDTYQEINDAGLIDDGLNPKDWYTNEFSPNAP